MITCINKLSLTHSGYLLGGLCPALLLFQLMPGWLKSPMNTIVCKHEASSRWRLHLLFDQASSSRHLMVSPILVCPLNITRKLLTGLSPARGQSSTHSIHSSVQHYLSHLQILLFLKGMNPANCNIPVMQAIAPHCQNPNKVISL